MWHPPSGGMFSLTVGVNTIAHASLVRAPHEKWTLGQRRKIVRRLLTGKLRLSVSEEEEEEREEKEPGAEREVGNVGARTENSNLSDGVDTPAFSPEVAGVDNTAAQNGQEEEYDSTVSSSISGEDDLPQRRPSERKNTDEQGSNGKTTGDLSSESAGARGNAIAKVMTGKRETVDGDGGNDDAEGGWDDGRGGGSEAVLQATTVRHWEGIDGRFTRDTTTDRSKTRWSVYALR